MDSLIIGLAGGIIISIITIGLQIKWRLKSIEDLLREILLKNNRNGDKQ